MVTPWLDTSQYLSWKTGSSQCLKSNINICWHPPIHEIIWTCWWNFRKQRLQCCRSSLVPKATTVTSLIWTDTVAVSKCFPVLASSRCYDCRQKHFILHWHCHFVHTLTQKNSFHSKYKPPPPPPPPDPISCTTSFSTTIDQSAADHCTLISLLWLSAGLIFYWTLMHYKIKLTPQNLVTLKKFNHFWHVLNTELPVNYKKKRLITV